MRSKLDGPELFLLNGFFRCPDLEPLNPVLTDVCSALSPFWRRLCLLRRDFDVPGLLDALLLRANQLSSLAQKRVMSVVRAAIDFASPSRGAGQATRHGCYA